MAEKSASRPAMTFSSEISKSRGNGGMLAFHDAEIRHDSERVGIIAYRNRSMAKSGTIDLNVSSWLA